MIEIGKLRFNTTGPCFPNKHYMLDALGRLPDIDGKTIHCYGV